MAVKYEEKLARAGELFASARALLTKEDITQEDRTNANKMIADAKVLKDEGFQLKELEADMKKLQTGKSGGSGASSNDDGSHEFKSFKEELYHIALAGNHRYRGQLHPSLEQLRFSDPDDAKVGVPQTGKGNSWESEFSRKDMSESVGASGGFLVAQEFRPEMFALPAPVDNIRALATVMPMRSRQLVMPRLDQSGTTAGSPHFFGGIEADWTEEAGEKAQSDPTFGQIVLTAWKLVCYTRASDELLADSATALAAFLTGPMGFAGAIKWEEEYTFLRGHGAGQPLGVINAPGTLTQARVSTAKITIEDILGMVEKAYGDNLTWHISRSNFSKLMQLNGPTASSNPQFIFIPNGRDGAPATLMGYPISWSDKMPATNNKGDFTLANWRFYVIGDRQATTIDSTNIERFRNDQTSWRAVHRVDGQPWLKAPLTYQDGVTQVSPFVVLDVKSS